MDFEKIKQTMTKEEFFNESELTGGNGCPSEYGLEDSKINGDCGHISCKKCWEKAIKKGNVKFKDDATTTEEQKVIDALKVVKDFCANKFNCDGCKFNNDNECKIKKATDEHVPEFFEIKNLENLIKKEVVIYKVEHSKGGKQYTFVADEDLPIGIIVYCDTKHGQTYGKIVDWFKGVDDGNKKCWRLK